MITVNWPYTLWIFSNIEQKKSVSKYASECLTAVRRVIMHTCELSIFEMMMRVSFLSPVGLPTWQDTVSGQTT